MDVFLSVCSHKDNLHAKAAFLIVVCLRKGSSSAPGIDHIVVAFFTGNVQGLCQLLIHCRIACKFINMVVQLRNLSRRFCFSKADYIWRCGNCHIVFVNVYKLISQKHRIEGSFFPVNLSS